MSFGNDSSHRYHSSLLAGCKYSLFDIHAMLNLGYHPGFDLVSEHIFDLFWVNQSMPSILSQSVLTLSISYPWIPGCMPRLDRPFEDV